MDERLRAFLGKEKTYKKDDGAEITLKPFKTKDLHLFEGLTEDVKADEIKKLILAALLNSDYEMTLEELDEYPMSFINWLTECISDVNGFKLGK